MMSGRSGKLLLGSEFVASEFAGVSQSPWLATLGGKLAEEEEEECDAVWIAEMRHIGVEEFPIGIDIFFRLFLSEETPFMKEFHHRKGDTEVEIERFQSLEPGVPHIRSIRYRTSISGSKLFRGTKQTYVLETQRMLVLKSNNKTQSHIILHDSLITADLPGSDTFQIEVR